MKHLLYLGSQNLRGSAPSQVFLSTSRDEVEEMLILLLSSTLRLLVCGCKGSIKGEALARCAWGRLGPR
jgi:hypothetical protein